MQMIFINKNKNQSLQDQTKQIKSELNKPTLLKQYTYIKRYNMLANISNYPKKCDACG